MGEGGSVVGGINGAEWRRWEGASAISTEFFSTW